MKASTLISINDISVDYEIASGGGILKKAYLRAIQDISFVIKEGDTWSVVGESGSGKSTLAMALIGLITLSDGTINYNFNDQKITISSKKGKRKGMKSLWRKIGIVFQDPFSALDPRILIKDIISEPFIGHKIGKKTEVMKRIEKLLPLVGLRAEYLEYFPDQLSGGLRQRVSIARALINEPEFIIFDEPTSSLDVSLQAQILNLIKSIQRSTKLTYLFITHNLMVARYISENIIVMYLGNILEKGKTADIFEKPLHPYTQLLMASIPLPEPGYELKKPSAERVTQGSGITIPNGCVFHDRCPVATPYCGWTPDELITIIANELYNLTGERGISAEIISETSFDIHVVNGNIISEVKDIISRNSKFFKTFREGGNVFHIELFIPWKPRMIKVDEYREVKCILLDKEFK